MDQSDTATAAKRENRKTKKKKKKGKEDKRNNVCRLLFTKKAMHHVFLKRRSARSVGNC